MTKSTGAHRKPNRPRLFAYSLGFLFQHHIRKIIAALGADIRFGLPVAKTDTVVVWGRRPVSKRGMAIARFFKKPVVTVEDGFLRSVLTGRQGARPMGLVLDHTGIYFDTSIPNDLDRLFKESIELSEAELQNAAEKMLHMQHLKLSKYNNFQPVTPDLPDDFILVIDQTEGDAAITFGGADADSFADMLKAAKSENPDKKILIKTHPETIIGQRKGYFSDFNCDVQTSLITAQIPPAILFEKASKIYCVTSQMGLEAIFSGHRPITFGRPFYAGLGLTEDRGCDWDRGLQLTSAQLFWATYLQYSKWYDPYFERATDFIALTGILHAQMRQHRDNQIPAICLGMRLWKRGFLRKFLSCGRSAPLFYDDETAAVEAASIRQGRVLVWAGRETTGLAKTCALREVPLVRVEDGFLRSVGLGAQLIAPVSLAFDNTGIYYDPTRPSQLEGIISDHKSLSQIDLARASAAQKRIVALNMTKYNLAATSVKLAANKGQEIVLVPGQVEDDASIIKGAGVVKTNHALLQAVRRDFPDAYIIFKPHPDVEAGLRTGNIDRDVALKQADIIAPDSNMAALLSQVDRVATITSLAGFEALLRGKAVTCYGSPFYSGWGLTQDKAAKISRRKARPDLDALVHACLIDYPRYWDPVTGSPCPVEVILERFERGQMQAKSGVMVRILAKLQGLFASYAHLWR